MGTLRKSRKQEVMKQIDFNGNEAVCEQEAMDDGKKMKTLKRTFLKKKKQKKGM